MNKTVFNLDLKISTIIIGVLGIILAFLSNVFYINGVVGYLLYIFRVILFFGVYVTLVLIEKSNKEFREANKRLGCVFMIGNIINIVCALFSVFHILKFLFLNLSGFICFSMIVACVLEILNIYYDKKVLKMIMKKLDKVSNLLLNPFLELFKRGL